MTSYDGWADVYDSIYAYVREDIPFYVQEAVRSGSPVLELGCGTGRVTLPIAQSGIDIVGLDNSEGMLAKSERQSGPPWRRGWQHGPLHGRHAGLLAGPNIPPRHHPLSRSPRVSSAWKTRSDA